jgi:hypothetical protein
MVPYENLTDLILILVFMTGQAFPQDSSQEEMIKALKGIETQLDDMNRARKQEENRRGWEKMMEMQKQIQEEEDKRMGIKRDSSGSIKSMALGKPPPPPKEW